MFQFRRFPTYAYLIQRRLTEYCSAGFPHSEICGSKLMCSSPQLIAACHVLHRLLMPRHSPCALISLTSLAHSSACLLVLIRIMQASQKIFMQNCIYPYAHFHVRLIPQFLFPLLLARNSRNLLCSVFKVQSSNLFQGQK